MNFSQILNAAKPPLRDAARKYAPEIIKFLGLASKSASTKAPMAGQRIMGGLGALESGMKRALPYGVAAGGAGFALNPGFRESVIGNTQNVVGDVVGALPGSEDSGGSNAQRIPQTPYSGGAPYGAYPPAPPDYGRMGDPFFTELLDFSRSQANKNYELNRQALSPERYAQLSDIDQRRQESTMRLAQDQAMEKSRERTLRDRIQAWRDIEVATIKQRGLIALGMGQMAYQAATPNANVMGAMAAPLQAALQAYGQPAPVQAFRR